MAELVDALRSCRSVLMDVEVRVLFWAPAAFPNQSELLRWNTSKRWYLTGYRGKLIMSAPENGGF